MMFNKFVIIGVGLIGGSLAKALKNKNAARNIVGYGRSAKSLQKAKELNIIDTWTEDIAAALYQADVVIIATPIGTFTKIFALMKPHLSAQTIISDVGSAKLKIIAAAKKHLGSQAQQFIAAHPIAGREKSGISAADGNLFANRRVILTPTKNNHPKDIGRIKDLWHLVGAVVDIMAAKTHDKVLAASSHLPHILAFALMDYLSAQDDNIYQYAAGGFRDFSRIASSNSVMWRDICLSNQTEIIKSIDNYQSHLNHLKDCIKNNQADALYDLFKSAKTKRDQWLEKHND